VTSGLLASDQVSAISLNSLGTASNAAAGSYVVVASNAQGQGLGNYDIHYVDGSLTVNKAALTITAENASKAMGRKANLNLFSSRGLIDGDRIEAVDLFSQGAEASAQAGRYAIVASNARGNGLGNYDISFVDGLLTVVGIPQKTVVDTRLPQAQIAASQTREEHRRPVTAASPAPTALAIDIPQLNIVNHGIRLPEGI